MPSSSYSTGSSAVRIFVPILLTSLRGCVKGSCFTRTCRTSYNKNTIGSVNCSAYSVMISSGMDSFSMSRLIADWSRTRHTTLSPNEVGKVETRRSTGLPPIVILIRPSCGILRSAILRSAKTFTREITGTASVSGVVPSRKVHHQYGI